MGDWTFFSNYGHVLVCLARNREARLRDVAAEVGITERAVQKIVRDMQDEGFLTVSKQGRCNRYRINRRKTLRHELESRCTVGNLLTLVARSAPPGSAERERDEVADEVAEQLPGRSKTQVPQKDSSAGGAADSVEPVTVARAPKEKSSKDKKPGKKSPPADTRQQGSLF